LGARLATNLRGHYRNESSVDEIVRNVATLFGDIWSQVQQFLDPIVVSYGPAWTAALLGLLLAAFGILAFSHR